MFLNVHPCCTNKFTDSMQSLSKLQWYFSEILEKNYELQMEQQKTQNIQSNLEQEE
jgi:FtsZ-binding cell division protein ZapB